MWTFTGSLYPGVSTSASNTAKFRLANGPLPDVTGSVVGVDAERITVAPNGTISVGVTSVPGGMWQLTAPSGAMANFLDPGDGQTVALGSLWAVETTPVPPSTADVLTAKVAALSDALSHLQSVVTSLENATPPVANPTSPTIAPEDTADIQALRDQITALQADKANTEEQIAVLQADMQQSITEENELDTRVSKLENAPAPDNSQQSSELQSEIENVYTSLDSRVTTLESAKPTVAPFVYLEATAAGDSIQRNGFYSVGMNTGISQQGGWRAFGDYEFSVPMSGIYLCIFNLRISDGSPSRNVFMNVDTQNRDYPSGTWANLGNGNRDTRQIVVEAHFNAGDHLRAVVYSENNDFPLSQARLSARLVNADN